MEGFPLGWKLSRQRLMRGDKFAPPTGMYPSPETEHPTCRSAFRSLTNLNHFYPVAGARRKPTKSRSMGFCAGAAGNSSTEYGYTKICTNEKQGAKIPLIKVLAVKGSLSRSPLQGLGQSPKVFFCHFYPVAERDGSRANPA